MTSLLKGLVLLIFFGSLGVALWAMREGNFQPTLYAGTWQPVLMYGTGLVLGPLIGILCGWSARAVMRRDFEEVADRGPSSYRVVAHLVLRYPAMYYLFMAVVVAFPLAAAAWGATELIDHRHNRPAGEATCRVAATRTESEGVRYRLRCPTPKGTQPVELLVPGMAPASLPQELTVRLSRGVLGSVFIAGPPGSK